MTTFDAALLDRYPAVFRGSIQRHEGGFSGADIWRLETVAGSFCVRAWPAGMIDTRLAFIHRLLQRASALDFVPRLIVASDGATAPVLHGRFWEMTTWLPGRADFLTSPGTARMRAACVALAHLHTAWQQAGSAICPAVERRLAALEQWQDLLEQGWRPQWREDDLVAPWARRAWLQVQPRAADVARRLEPWLAHQVPVQPCLCDLWHAHVLYSDERVTGLIDYGSVKVDHVAVDLARLLGSLAGDDSALWRAGLDAYAELRPLAGWERDLVRDLDDTGTVIAAMNWLRWLYHEGRSYRDRASVAERLAAQVRRLEASSGR